MSLREITDVTLAAQRREARHNYDIALMVSHAVNSPKTFPKSIRKAYPGLFNDKKQADWQESKKAMARYAREHNKKLRKGRSG